jgi:hypothetical protein
VLATNRLGKNNGRAQNHRKSSGFIITEKPGIVNSPTLGTNRIAINKKSKYLPGIVFIGLSASIT